MGILRRDTLAKDRLAIVFLLAFVFFFAGVAIDTYSPEMPQDLINKWAIHNILMMSSVLFISVSFLFIITVISPTWGTFGWMHSRKTALPLHFVLAVVFIAGVEWANPNDRSKSEKEISRQDNEQTQVAEDDLELDGQAVALDDKGLLTGHLSQSWTPLGSGKQFATSPSAPITILAKDLACLKAHVVIANRGNIATKVPVLFEISTNAGRYSVRGVVDGHTGNERRDWITIPPNRELKVKLTLTCLEFLELSSGTVTLVHLSSGGHWTIEPPPPHDEFYMKEGCGHFLDATIVSQEWTGVAAGTIVRGSGSNSDQQYVIKHDLASIKLILRLTNRSGGNVSLHPKIGLADKNLSVLGRMSLTSAKNENETDRAKTIVVGGNVQVTVSMISKAMNYDELSQIGRLFLYSSVHSWKIALSPFPSHEALYSKK